MKHNKTIISNKYQQYNTKSSNTKSQTYLFKLSVKLLSLIVIRNTIKVNIYITHTGIVLNNIF